MSPFFLPPARRALLWVEMQRWLGTPFHANAASVGHGVDCVRLVHEILSSCGAIPRLELPAYTLDHAKHTLDSALLRFLLTHDELRGRWALIPFNAERMPGDILGIKSGRADHHLALVSPWAEVVHAVEDHGVIRTPLNDRKLEARTVYVLRIMEARA